MANSISKFKKYIEAGEDPTFTPEQFAAADMNGDGLITPSDVAAIMEVYSESATENPNAPAQNVVLDVNGEKLTVGIPNAVISNGFTVTVDCGLKLIYYTTADGTKVNILQYSYGDLPLLHAEFLNSDHERLNNCLKGIKGKFILSYNDDEYIRDLYRDFDITAVERQNNLSKGSFKELIIKNY